ncbi:MAG: NTP transferase domain-containing protein [Opitutaceae bacterium]
MIGVILAAGKGSRLGAHTEDLPKSLLPLNDEITLLDYNLGILNELAVDHIYIVTGFSAKKIMHHVSTMDNVTCVFNPFWNVCNVLGSLYMALPHVKDDFLFLHADTLVGMGGWKQLVKEDGDIVLPYQAKPCGEEEMKVKHSEDGRLELITKEMEGSEADGEFLGIAKFKLSILPYLKQVSQEIFEAEGLHQYMESVVQIAIDSGKDVQTFDIGAEDFVEVDFAEDYEIAKKTFG